MRKEYDFSKAKRGAVIPSPGKTRITIMLDDDQRRAARGGCFGTGRYNEDRPLTVSILRKVLREELQQ